MVEGMKVDLTDTAVATAQDTAVDTWCYGGPSIGFGFSYAPGWSGYYGYPACDPAYGCGPAYYPPAYYPPVVGGVVVGGGFGYGHGFVGRGGDWHRFARR